MVLGEGDGLRKLGNELGKAGDGKGIIKGIRKEVRDREGSSALILFHTFSLYFPLSYSLTALLN